MEFSEAEERRQGLLGLRDGQCKGMEAGDGEVSTGIERKPLGAESHNMSIVAEKAGCPRYCKSNWVVHI